MNREDIIKLAQECQLIGMRPHLDGIYQDALERFAALVAADERERVAAEWDGKMYGDLEDIDIGAAIRTRGQA